MSCVEFTAAERPKKRDGGHSESGDEGNLGNAIKLSEIRANWTY